MQLCDVLWLHCKCSLLSNVAYARENETIVSTSMHFHPAEEVPIGIRFLIDESIGWK